MTTTGGDDINLAQENDQDDDHHDDGNVDLDGHDDGTGNTTATAPLQEVATMGQPISTSGSNKTKFRNSLVSKARTPFLQRISSDDWKISPRQIDGRMPRLTTTSPTPSGIRHESGCHQSSTGTRMRTSGWSGQISRTCSSKNMRSKQATN